MAETTLRTIVPAMTGRAVRVQRGQFVRVTDLAGQQVGDLFAFTGSEYLSASHTRMATNSIFPAVGQAFVTNRRRPILTLRELIEYAQDCGDVTFARCHDLAVRASADSELPVRPVSLPVVDPEVYP